MYAEKCAAWPLASGCSSFRCWMTLRSHRTAALPTTRIALRGTWQLAPICKLPCCPLSLTSGWLRRCSWAGGSAHRQWTCFHLECVAGRQVAPTNAMCVCTRGAIAGHGRPAQSIQAMQAAAALLFTLLPSTPPTDCDRGATQARLPAAAGGWRGVPAGALLCFHDMLP